MKHFPLCSLLAAGLALASLSGCAYYDGGGYYYDDPYYYGGGTVYSGAAWGYSPYYRDRYYHGHYDGNHHGYHDGYHVRHYRGDSGHDHRGDSDRDNERMKLVRYNERDRRRDLPSGYHSADWFKKRGYSLSQNTFRERDGDTRGREKSSSSSRSSRSDRSDRGNTGGHGGDKKGSKR